MNNILNRNNFIKLYEQEIINQNSNQSTINNNTNNSIPPTPPTSNVGSSVNKQTGTSQVVDQNKKQLSDKLVKAFIGGPATTRQFLDSEEGKSNELRELLKQPKLDGQLNDDVVQITDYKDVPVNTLVPTQNFIDLMQSVAYPLADMKSLIKNITDKKGFGTIIISPKGKNDKLPEGCQYLIIDGHHRWSGIYAIDPNGKIDAKIVNWPGVDTKQKLASAQIAIAAKLGTGKNIPSASGTPAFNILGKDANFISNLIMQNINKKTDMGAPAPLLNDNMINDIVKQRYGESKVIYTWAGLDINETDINKIRQAIANKVGNNLSTLKSNPLAPPKEDMPQFANKVGGPEFNEVQNDLKTGTLNVSYPFIKK